MILKVQDKARIQTKYFPLKILSLNFPVHIQLIWPFSSCFIPNFSNECELLLLSLSLIYVYMYI